MGRTVDSAAYLQAVIHEWRVVKPDGVPLRAVYTLLQARERPRERPREGQDAPTRDLEALPEERAAAAGVLRKIIDKRKRGKQRAEPHPSEEDDREEGRAARPTEEAPKPPPPPVPLHEALGQALHMVLVGEPGAGKSVTLQYLGLVYACAARVPWRAADPPEPCGQGAFTPPPLGLADEPLRIPFLIRLTDPAFLKRLDEPEALEHYMLALWRDLKSDPALTLDDLRGWREQGRLLVLLDGLDEVDAAQRARVREAIRRFRLRAEACRIVVATRPAGYHPPLPDFQDFTLQPLNEATAPHFLRQWMAALKCSSEDADQPKCSPDDPDLLREVETIWEHIQTQPGLRRLAATPLTLKMLAEVAAEGGLKAVRNRADLYQRAAEKAYWQRARGRGAPTDKKAWVLALVEAWAWARHAWGWRTEEEMRQTWATWTPPGADAAEPLVPPGDEARWEQARDWTRKYMLLKHGKEWAFWHQTWQEYFASRYLKKDWDRAVERAWPGLKPRLHHPAWQEVLYLLAAGMEDATPLVRRIRTARSPYEWELLRDRALAARLVGDGARVAEDEAQRLLGELQRLLSPRRARILQGALNHLKRWPLVTRSPRVWAWLTLPLRLGGLPVVAWRVQAVRALAVLGPRAIPVLERALKDADWHVRRAAAEALGVIEPAAADAVPALVRALGDADWRVHRAAARALGAIGPGAAEAAPALVRALGDADWRVHRAAARALGAIGPVAAEAVPTLVRTLENGDANTRAGAARALGAIGPAAAEAAPDLVRALGNGDWRVREAAAEALGAIGPAAVPTLVRALENGDANTRAGAARALGAIGPGAADAVPALVRVLGDVNWRVREAAARALGAIGPAAVPALVWALEDEDWRMRGAAAKALGAIGPAAADAVPALVWALEDESAWVRAAAAEALGAIGPGAADAVPALVRALGDKDRDARRTAAWALRAIGPAAAEAVPALVQALGDEDGEVRRAAARALGAIGPAAVPALERALKDTNWKVRQAAAEALGAIGPAAAKAVPALVRALEDEDWKVRQAAAEALGAIGPAAAKAVPALVRALGDERLWAREDAAWALGAIGPAAADAVPDLVRALKDTNWEVRQAAAWALGAIGPAAADAVPALVRALGDENEDVYWAAVEALEKIGPAAVPALAWALGDERPWVRAAAAWALKAIGPTAADAVPALVRALGDEDGEVRWTAARALKAIGPTAADAVPALVRALGDEDGEVRWTAARALKAIGPAAADAVPDLVRALRDASWRVREAAARALGNIAEGLDDLTLARKVAGALWWHMTDWSSGVREAAYKALGAVVARLTQLEVAQRVAKRKEPFPWSPPQEPQPMPRWRRAVWAVAAAVAFLLSSTLTAAINWLNSGIPTSPSAWRGFLVKSLSFGSLGAIAVGLAALARKLWRKASEKSVEG